MEPRISISRHKYRTLDGIRGVAALMVVLRHTGNYFGGIRFTESYLAVDLFFVLSGFVIAEAYNKRLTDGLTPGQFMRIRLIRLYPLYLLGSLLGVLYLLGIILAGNHPDTWTAFEIATNAALAILMIPTPLTQMLYPINAPSWSLLFELFSNALYAVFYPLLTIGRMFAVVTISAIALCICVYQIGNLDAGFYWKDIIVGIPRVLYSFGAGVLVHRYKKIHILHFPSWGLIFIVFVILCLAPSSQVRPWFDIIAVIILFPAIVYLASATETKTYWLNNLYALLGATSYGIYVLHVPLSKLITIVLKKGIAFEVAQFAPYTGIVLLMFLVLFTWWVDNHFDQPIRRMASNYFRE